MQAIQSQELNNLEIDKEDFKIFFIKNWPVGKEVLNKLSISMNRPLLKLAIQVLINLGDRLYQKSSENFNITL